jgi:hypothetical protein
MVKTRIARVNWAVRTAVVALSLAVRAHAGQTLNEYLSFSEFGTLGLVHSDYDKADFTGNVVQLNGAGYTGSWRVTPDSDLGIQANLTLTDRLTGVVQVISRDDSDGNYRPDLEWANLKYDFTSDLSARIGRILLPTSQFSDSQNVGYALPWVRLPLEFNYMDSTEHSDGVELLYQLKTGSATQRLQAQVGYSDENTPGADFGTTRSEVGMLSDTLQYGDTSGELVYQHYQHTGSLHMQEDLVGLSGTYDTGAYFLMAACNYADNSYFGGSIAGYFSVGVRVGKLTPYALYAVTHATSVGPSQLVDLGNEHTIALGLRWDFAANFDTKLQVEQVRLDSLDDTAAFANIQADAKPGDKAHVVSLTLDFVF